MNDWWAGLSAINRGFYAAAVFFGVIFAWQLLAALMGLADDGGGGLDADTDIDTDGVDLGSDTVDLDDVAHDAIHDGADTMLAFKLLSLRSVLTFCTLFTWGTALYLNRGDSLGRAMGISTTWGLVGMSCVGLLLAWVPRLAHSGNRDINTCIGAEGRVYLDIPAGGRGEIRVLISGAISYVKATCSTGEALKSGTPVVVEKAVDASNVVVHPLAVKQAGGAEDE